MEVITIGNHKGGTGKTATSLHIGAVFGLIGYKTLLIDLDPQGFLTRMMGVDTNSVVDTSLRLFEVDTSLAQLETVPLPSFHLLPSSEGMRTREKKLTSTIDLFLVKEALRGQDIYDVIILDTAAALSSYVLNALVAADTLMIPVTPELQSVHGAEQTWQSARAVQGRLNPGLKRLMFLLTNVHGRKKVHRQYANYMRKEHGRLVMDTVVRTCASVAVECHGGKTVFDNNMNSRGAKDYSAVVDELIRNEVVPVFEKNVDSGG